MKMLLIPTIILISFGLVVYLSYLGILPYDFNTTRGLISIGVIGSFCLAVLIIGERKLRGKEDKDNG